MPPKTTNVSMSEKEVTQAKKVFITNNRKVIRNPVFNKVPVRGRGGVNAASESNTGENFETRFSNLYKVPIPKVDDAPELD